MSVQGEIVGFMPLAGARAAGVIRSAYQFFRPNQDPIAQADLLLDRIGRAGFAPAR